MPEFKVTFRCRTSLSDPRISNQTVTVSAESELKARDKVKNSHMSDPSFTILQVSRS